MKRQAVIQRRASKGKSIDERFTDFADTISEVMGRWWVSAIAFVFVLIWLALGPVMNFSDSWQLWANSPTTIAELFIGFWLASAANRVERRNRSILDYQTQMLAHNHALHEKQLHLLELVEQLVEREQTDIEHIEEDIEH